MLRVLYSMLYQSDNICVRNRLECTYRGTAVGISWIRIFI